MARLENNRLLVDISDEDGRILVHDKATDTRWTQASSRVIVRKSGDRLRWHRLQAIRTERLDDRLRVQAQVEGTNLALTWDAVLAENGVTLQLLALDGLAPGEALDLAWPHGLIAGEQEDAGYLALPIRAGQLLPFNPTTKPDVHEDMIYAGLKMALFGAVKGRAAVAAIVRTPYDCRLRTEANIGGRYTASPMWVVEEGRLNYLRELQLVFLADASYVEIAKTYRQEMIARGRFVSLRRKCEASPYVEPLLGAVTGERRTYSIRPEGEPDIPSIRTFFEQAQELGFDRACIWFCWGTATPEELRREAAYARGLSPDYRLSRYTNVIDVKPAAPDYDARDVLRLRDGSPRVNFFVNQTVCASQRRKRAELRLPEVLEGIGPGNVYLDVEGAAGLMECFSEEHPMTREQDAHYRRDVLRYVKELFGSVTTEHLPHDFLCDVVDMGAYFCVYPYQVLDARENRERPYGEGEFDATAFRDAEGRDWYVRFSCPFQTIPVPLFQLVWHDSVLSMNSSGKYTESFRWLENYACEPMHLPLYGLLPDDLSQRSLMMSRAMRGTYLEELVEHRFLVGPVMEYTDRGLYRTRDVQLSRFGDGTIVIANFGDEPFFYDSHTPVPMHEFAILRPGHAPIIA